MRGYVRVCAYMCEVCICVYLYVHARSSVCLHIHTYPYASTHTHIHAPAHCVPSSFCVAYRRFNLAPPPVNQSINPSLQHCRVCSPKISRISKNILAFFLACLLHFVLSDPTHPRVRPSLSSSQFSLLPGNIPNLIPNPNRLALPIHIPTCIQLQLRNWVRSFLVISN